MTFLVTGCAGFIGFSVALRLLAEGHEVIGVDNMNSYYDVSLKESRLAVLQKECGFKFFYCDIADAYALGEIFSAHDIARVIHLAAQAGVRYSLDNPNAYAHSNLLGHLNILECCRKHNVEHLVYASSSSVYGANKKLPFSIKDRTDFPVSLYAATKKSNELMAYSYSHLFKIPMTGLRFFTVYGPWGRPDMAMFKFVKAIFGNDKLPVYNQGSLSRDFTYIDDIVEGVYRVQSLIPSCGNIRSDDSEGSPPFSVYNIGNGQPVQLMDFIEAIESEIGIKAEYDFLPMQPGDVEATWCDTSEFREAVGYEPKVTVGEGVKRFVKWYRDYYDC